MPADQQEDKRNADENARAVDPVKPACEDSSIPRSQPAKSAGRSKMLDALRAVAILLVLGRHTAVSDTWTKIGWCGVDLFFVISGFLISGLLFQEYK